MAGPIRTQQLPTEVQPPRPPNAWILYRSDKLRELPPPPPGAPRRPQAEISKAISQMWRNESPDVRAYYERMSDIRKAEHNVLHPGYRFKPVKKADKERQRAEQKAEKERAKAELRNTKAGAAPTHHRRSRSTEQQLDQFAFDGRWGPAGPSASGSASPSPAPFVSDPRFSPYPSPHSLHGFPSSPSAAPEPTSFSPAPMHFEFQAQIPGMFPQQQQQQQQHRQPASSPSPTSPFDELNWLAPEAQDNTLDDSEYLSIPLPTGTSSSWASDASLQNAFFSPDNLQATLSPTSDPSMFHLANFDTSNLFANPGADIEIALPQSVTFRDLEHLGVFGEFAHLLEPQSAVEASPVERSFPSSLAIPERSSDPLGGLDARMRQTSISSPPPPHRHLSATPPALNEYIITTPPQDAVQSRSVSNLSHTTVASFINHSADHFRSSPTPPPHQPSSSMPATQPIRYSSSTSSNVSAPSPRSQRQRSASAHEQQAYMHPVGAANAGGRRVAASWRNTFALEGATVKEVWSNV